MWKNDRKKIENMSVKENVRITTQIHSPRQETKRTERLVDKKEDNGSNSPMKISQVKSSRKVTLAQPE